MTARVSGQAPPGGVAADQGTRRICTTIRWQLIAVAPDSVSSRTFRTRYRRAPRGGLRCSRSISAVRRLLRPVRRGPHRTEASAAKDRRRRCRYAWDPRFEVAGAEVYRQTCALRLEGIVAKRADSLYRDGTCARDWQIPSALPMTAPAVAPAPPPRASGSASSSPPIGNWSCWPGALSVNTSSWLREMPIACRLFVTFSAPLKVVELSNENG